MTQDKAPDRLLYESLPVGPLRPTAVTWVAILAIISGALAFLGVPLSLWRAAYPLVRVDADPFLRTFRLYTAAAKRSAAIQRYSQDIAFGCSFVVLLWPVSILYYFNQPDIILAFEGKVTGTAVRLESLGP